MSDDGGDRFEMTQKVWLTLLIVILFCGAIGIARLVCGQEREELPVAKRPTINERLDAIETALKNEREVERARWAKHFRQMHRILKRLDIAEEGDLEAGDRPLRGVEPPEPEEP